MEHHNRTTIKQEELIITGDVYPELNIKEESECIPDSLEDEEYKNQKTKNHYEKKYKKVSKFDWCKESVLKLIQHWEEHECLYNLNHNGYNNKLTRLRALESITTNLLEIEPNITQFEVKTKMNYLRSQYVRELQKIKDSEKNCTDIEELYVPNAYWYNRLAFLREFVHKKPKCKSSVTDPADDSSISEMDELQSTPPNRVYQQPQDEPNIITTTSTTTKKRKKEIQMFDRDDHPTTSTSSSSSKHKRENETHFEEDNIDQFLNSANKLLTKLTKPENLREQCTESFIQLVKINLRDITDPDLKDEVCQKMISILFEYKKKQRLLSNA